MLNHAGIELESTRLEAVAAAGMAAVENGHIVLLCHLVDGGEEAVEVLLGIDVLLTMGAQKDILAFLKPEALMNVGSLYFGKVLVKHLSHRRTGYIGPLLGQAAIGEVSSCVLAVGHVHVGDDVNDPAVGFLREALVLATVAGLHMEDGNMEPLCTNHTQA